MSRLRTLVRDRRFAITAEVTPPLSCDPADLLAKALPLRGLADAVNVTDGASARAHMDAPVAAIILLQHGIEPVLQLTGRDRNRIALQSELVGAAAMGVHNLLMLRGDDPKAGDQPDAKPVFDLDSQALVETAAAIRDKGELLHGRKVGGAADFFIGVADAPLDPPADWSPASLLRKIAAGAEFAQTQFCMDLDVLRRYVARLADHGVIERLPLLIGIAPLASARSARWIRDNLKGSIIPERLIDRLEAAVDPKQEGREICVELLHGLAEIDGVAGAHLMAPLNEAAIPDVITAFRGFSHSAGGAPDLEPRLPLS
jgi:methylenetetrahydrofolate reductase (NADPH)